jgi:hypothetical protein
MKMMVQEERVAGRQRLPRIQMHGRTRPAAARNTVVLLARDPSCR